MNKSYKTLVLSLCTLLATTLWADELYLKDGSRLVGDIKSFNEGKIILATDFSGDLTIAASKIEKISTNDSKVVRLADGEILTGQMEAASAGTKLKTSTGSAELAPTQIAAAWDVGAIDPAVEAKLPKWNFEMLAAFTGETGNSPSSEMKGAAKAVRKADDTRLETSLRFKLAEDELSSGKTERTEEEIIGDIKYTSFFSDDFGWYVREELELDRFENIELRSTSAAGITWKPIDTDLRKLEISGGLSFRTENYGFDLNDDGVDDKTGSESFPGLDVGLTHFWEINDWLSMNNKLTYNPAFEDLGDFRIDHLSSLDIPLGKGEHKWNFRLFLENQYNSRVAAATEKLDTTYGVAVVLKWK